MHHPRTRKTHARRLVALCAAAVAGLSLTACGPEDTPTTTTSAAAQTDLPTSDARGGVLRALSLGPVVTWDPQRMAARDDISVAGRLFARSLTAYATGDDANGQRRLVGDLATDTGTPTKDLRTWRFTLRKDLKWDNGDDVTCTDVKYGISRAFATKDVTGGPAYAVAVLDVPKKPDGTSTYAGPYDGTAATQPGRRAFDKAVTCSGGTITFRLSGPMSDFNEMLTLPAFGPYRRADDKRSKATHTVMSTGPYMLRDAWQSSSGGTYVRNPTWSEESDPVRKALPDTIEVREGVETPTAVQQVTADGADGTNAVTLNSAPPALQQQILAATALRSRTVNPRTTLVDYLVPNYRSQVFRLTKARLALALATDRDAYTNALGGPTTADVATSVIPAQLRSGEAAEPGSTSAPTTSAPTGTSTRSAARATSTGPSQTSTATGTATRTGTGTDSPTVTDTTTSTSTTAPADRARELLASSGLTLPVKITVAYRQGETADKAMAALVAGWRAAGFEPTLKPVEDDYFTTVSKPGARTYDVIWSNWAPEWASASTILPPLFDSRINLSAKGTGRDYGYYANDRLNAEMDKVPAIRDRSDREKAWAGLDDQLLRAGAYVPLAQRRALYVAGTSVRNLSGNEVAGGYVELAGLGVE
jgi:peptide/nickel transport system substrate-binding protein